MGLLGVIISHIAIQYLCCKENLYPVLKMGGSRAIGSVLLNKKELVTLIVLKLRTINGEMYDLSYMSAEK